MAELSEEISLAAEDATGGATLVSALCGEVRILRMSAAGESPSVIANELRITPQTLRNQLHHKSTVSSEYITGSSSNACCPA
jgi:DNA-binding NarL/FixJ family response regulator